MNQQIIIAAKEIGYHLEISTADEKKNSEFAALIGEDGPIEEWYIWELYDPSGASRGDVRGHYDGDDAEMAGWLCTLPAFVADALVIDPTCDNCYYFSMCTNITEDHETDECPMYEYENKDTL